MPLKEWKMQTFFYSFSTALSHDKAIILQSHRAKGSSRATSPHHTWHLSGSSCLFCFPSSSFLQALDTNRIFWSGKCTHSKHPGWKGFSPRNSCAFQAWVPWISMFPSFFSINHHLGWYWTWFLKDEQMPLILFLTLFCLMDPENYILL